MAYQVAVLFARKDSIYKKLNFCDVYDIARDARIYTGNLPIIAHPPCRAWGRLRHMANPRHDEKDLAHFAIQQIRRCGGVLEHPAASTLWDSANLPKPGRHAVHGEFSISVNQSWWGHRAEKKTWLYINGCRAQDLPPIPMSFQRIDYVITQSKRMGDAGWRSRVPDWEREATPVEFAHWLCEVALKCNKESA